jgi:hypothetical protein
MDRRKFLGSLIGGIAATAAVRTWPFRVYSFPSDITVTESEAVPYLIGEIRHGGFLIPEEFIREVAKILKT